MSESKVKPEYDSQGRPIISATRLLKRKAVFHRLLIDLVKQHHKVLNINSSDADKVARALAGMVLAV